MRPVFVCGAPRSGTTLLGAMLGAHSRCLCVPEMHFGIRHLAARDWEYNPISAADLAEILEESWDFRVWNVSGSAVVRELEKQSAAAGRLQYRQVVEGLVRLYGQNVGKAEADVWIDHTPGNLRQIGKLLKTFPEARLLHLVRDGRGVAASIMPLDWGPHTISHAAQTWAAWLSFGLVGEIVHPERVLRVHYEELVSRPRHVLYTICDWVDLDFEENLGSQTDYRLPRLNDQQHALVPYAPDPTRASAWRKSLSSRQIEIFESLNGELLAALDYDLEFGGLARRAGGWEKLKLRLSAMAATPIRRLRWSLLKKLKVRSREKGR